MANHPPATINSVHPVHESTSQVMAQAAKNLKSTGPDKAHQAPKTVGKGSAPKARPNNPNAGIDQQYKQDISRGSFW